MVTNFFSNKELTLQKKLLKYGYIIFDIKERAVLKKIKNEVIKLVLKWLKKKKIKNYNKKKILEKIHNIISPPQLNQFRLYIYENLNKSKSFSKNYFFLGKEYLEILCSNELAMQKKINLSIQMVKDDSSVLPLHSDVWQGDSPYELVLWVSLVNCKNTQSMFILPKKFNDKYKKKFSHTKSTSKIFDLVKKKLKWLKIDYGQGLIFTQNVMHGNVVNYESATRWSFNCRFKSLLSPYKSKAIGDFFIPITIRSATKLGMNYEYPKVKK